MTTLDQINKHERAVELLEAVGAMEARRQHHIGSQITWRQFPDQVKKSKHNAEICDMAKFRLTEKYRQHLKSINPA